MLPILVPKVSIGHQVGVLCEASCDIGVHAIWVPLILYRARVTSGALAAGLMLTGSIDTHCVELSAFLTYL